MSDISIVNATTARQTADFNAETNHQIELQRVINQIKIVIKEGKFSTVFTSCYESSSLSKIKKYLESKGYVLIHNFSSNSLTISW